MINEDVAIILELICENALFVKEAPGGTLHYDTIYSHLNNTQMLIRTESEWSKKFRIDIPMQFIPSKNNMYKIQIKAQIDHPVAYEEDLKWFSREYSIPIYNR